MNWKYFSLIVSLLLALGAGAAGGVATAGEIAGWYAGLAMPSIAPPNWVFGPVWTLLYILMGVAAWLVYESTAETEGVRRAKRAALGAYALQLVLNTLWSILFFGFHALGLALVELIILWAAILATMIAFFPLSRTAGWLMLPYLAWVTFAGFLNYGFFALNS